MSRNDKKGGRPRTDTSPEANPINQEKFKVITELYELDDFDKKLLRMHNRFPDAPKAELAAYFNVNVTTIDERMNKPVYKAAFRDYNSSHQDLYDQALKKALRVCINLMDSSDPYVKLKSADTVFKLTKTDISLTQVNVQQNTKRVFRTTVQDDGTLLGMVMDEELNKETIDASVEVGSQVS